MIVFRALNHRSLVIKIITLFTLVVAVLALVFPGWGNLYGKRATSAKSLLRAGIKAFARGTLDEAILNWQQALQASPGQTELIYNLALAYETTGRDEAAITGFKQVLELNPNLVTPRYNLAVHYIARGQTDMAQEELRKALEVAPYFVGARLMLGELLQAEGFWDEALAEYRQVTAQNVKTTLDMAEVYYRIGVIEQRKGNLPEARKAWETALRINSGHMGAQEALRTNR